MLQVHWVRCESGEGLGSEGVLETWVVLTCMVQVGPMDFLAFRREVTGECRRCPKPEGKLSRNLI